MHPDLIDLGPITIHAYGLMMALAFVAGIWYIRHRHAAERLSLETLLNVAYIMIIGGVIGARLAFAVLHWSEFEDNLLNIINPFQAGQFGISGMNLYGGVLLGIGGASVYIYKRSLPLLAVFDIFAPTLGLGLGIARIGCFLNGCCFGTPTGLPWGVTFPAGSMPDFIFESQPLHPTQLYSSLYGLIIFIILNALIKRKGFDGQIVAILFMAESFFRFIIEPVRYYEAAMTFSLIGLEVTYNQLVAVSLFAIGIIIYLKAPRNLYRRSIVLTALPYD